MEAVNKLFTDRLTEVLRARGVKIDIDVFFHANIISNPNDSGIWLHAQGNERNLADCISDKLRPILQQYRIAYLGVFHDVEKVSEMPYVGIEFNCIPDLSEPLVKDTHYQNAFTAAIADAIEEYVKDFSAVLKKLHQHLEIPKEEPKKYSCKHCGESFDASLKLATHTRKCKAQLKK